MKNFTIISLAGLMMASSPAQAGSVEEVRAGLSAQSVGFISPDVEDGVAFSGEVLFKAPDILSAIWNPKPHIGFSLATAGNGTSYIYSGLTWRKSFLSEKFFVDVGVGGAIHDGRISFNPAIDLPRTDGSFLGCPVLFRLHAAPGIRLNERWSASLQWEHLSNAGLCDENEGLDNIGFRLSYRF